MTRCFNVQVIFGCGAYNILHTMQDKRMHTGACTLLSGNLSPLRAMHHRVAQQMLSSLRFKEQDLDLYTYQAGWDKARNIRNTGAAQTASD